MGHRSLGIAGWIVPAQAPVAAVDLTWEEHRVGRAAVGLERPGVAAAHEGPLAVDAGFSAAVNCAALRAGEELELAVRAVLGDGTRSELGCVRVRREARVDPAAPLVSVVIPCWNQAHYLGEAIESALSQSYPSLEVIVVDDGSEDNSAAVAARFPGVRCLRQGNSGVAAARNRGLAEAGGEYAVFLDADDRLLPDALAVGVRELEARPETAFAAGMPRDI
ncbi:MAG TPA: glycosyltransferase family A protein, partial [Solirubrobacterales bacterium]|nr:glycosyltransferase family A protein [Solirubrobacterales bacterium]